MGILDIRRTKNALIFEDVTFEVVLPVASFSDAVHLAEALPAGESRMEPLLNHVESAFPVEMGDQSPLSRFQEV